MTADPAHELRRQAKLMLDTLSAVSTLLLDRERLYDEAEAEGRIPRGTIRLIPIPEVLAVLNAAATIGFDIAAEEAAELSIEQVLDFVREHASVIALVAAAERDDAYCCQHGCGTGACEVCPCCTAGWCVMGSDGVPDEDDENYAAWLEIAAEHNPIAAALRAAELEAASGGESL